MVRGIATKPVRIGSDKIYLTKTRDFLKGALMEVEKENWNSAAVLSIHAVISACDAVCAKFLQIRHGGVDHMQAIELLGSLPFKRSEIESKLCYFFHNNTFYIFFHYRMGMVDFDQFLPSLFSLIS